MLAGNNLPDGLTKKEQILNLALRNWSNEQIAKEVAASREYVAKVKSEAKAGSLKGKAPLPVPVSLHTSSKESPAQPNYRQRYTSALSGGNSLSETEENIKIRKMLWKKFSEQEAPDRIVRDTGLNPGMVWSEYEYFLFFTKRDLHALQRGLMDDLSKRMAQRNISANTNLEGAYKKLQESYKANGFWTNSELRDVVELISKIGVESGKEQALNASSHHGWRKPPCKNCGGPIYGLYADQNQEVGKRALSAVSNMTHPDCNQSEDERSKSLLGERQ